MIEPNSELVIDYELVRNNIQVIKTNLPTNCKILGVIKSNAYGHDLEKATQALDDAIDGYGVVRLQEALKIRENSSKPVLAMQGVYSSDAYDALKKNNIWSVITQHDVSTDEKERSFSFACNEKSMVNLSKTSCK